MLKRLITKLYVSVHAVDIKELNEIKSNLRKIDNASHLEETLRGNTPNGVLIKATKLRAQLSRNGFNNIVIGNPCMHTDTECTVTVRYKSLPINAIDDYKSMKSRFEILEKKLRFYNTYLVEV